MPFQGTGKSPYDWDAETQKQMKQILDQMYLDNETSGNPYQFSLADADSGYSFGRAQWDPRGNPTIVRPMLESLGFTPAEIDRLQRLVPITDKDLNGYTDDQGNYHLGFNQRLQTTDNRKKIDQFFEDKLNTDLKVLGNRYNTLANDGAIGKQVAKYLIDHPVMLVMLVDFNNQFGLGPAGLLMRYLQGEKVALGDPDHPGAHDVPISLADNHPGQKTPTFDLSDYAIFLFDTWQARKNVAGGNDMARRFTNDLKLFNGWPNLSATEVAKLKTALEGLTMLGTDASRAPSIEKNIAPQLLGRTGDLVPGDVLRAAYADLRQTNAVVSYPIWDSGTLFAGHDADGFPLYYRETIAGVPWVDQREFFSPGRWRWVWDTGVGTYDSRDVRENLYENLFGHVFSSVGPYLPAVAGTSYQVIWEYGREAHRWMLANLPGQSPIVSIPSGFFTPMEQQWPVQPVVEYRWPSGGEGDMPADVLEAAGDSRWGTIAPTLARQIADRLGLATSETGTNPTLLVNLESGSPPATITGAPFLRNEWLAPGDSILVWDPSTLRSLTADGPGETVVGLTPNAVLDGRPGHDVLWAGPGTATLMGGVADILHGGSGNDTFILGPDDVAFGGPGANTFDVSLGSGQTTISAGAGKSDPVRFGTGIEPDDVRVVPRGWTDDLVLTIPKSGDTVVLKDWYETFAGEGHQAADDPYQEHPEWGTRIAQVVFADGTIWDAALLREKSLIANGPGQTIVGFNTDDILVGRYSHDELWAGAGNDTLIGGPDGVLHGGGGNDVFVAGRNDVIDTGSGTNMVKYRRDEGYVVVNADAGDGTTTVEMGSGEVKPLDLVFTLQPNSNQSDDLQVSVQSRSDDFGEGDDRRRHGDDRATSDRVAGLSVPNWAAGATSGGRLPVTAFTTTDATLAGTDVGPLIQAMATFTADTGLSWDQAIERRPEDVEAILTQYWHATGRQAIGSPEDQQDRGDHGDHGHGWSR